MWTVWTILVSECGRLWRTVINKRPEQLKRLAALFSNLANEMRVEVCWGGGAHKEEDRKCVLCQEAEPSVCSLLSGMDQSEWPVVASFLAHLFCLMSCELTLSRRTVDVYVRWWIKCNDRLLNLRISPVCLLLLDNHSFTVDSLVTALWCCSVSPAVHLTFKHNQSWLFSKCH